VDRNDLHVIVVGGGLSGLAAALLLARRGHRVTLVERDADTPRGGPDQVFSDLARPGVPQARHPHNFQAAVAGQPAPPPDPAERLRFAAFHAARTDADIAVALRRMLHLVARPDEILGNPALVSQLRALVNTRPELTAVAAGPTREEVAA
jgi:glycine/D-amino acid oxidase-like deaminating enzyme